MLLVAVPWLAHARVHRSSDWANTQFDNAEDLRDKLDARPAADRTRAEYQKVVNAYRRIYLGAPTSSKAAAAVTTEAEVMTAMGRQYQDEKILRGAIEKYEFLRREYPGAESRVDALFAIGQIYKDDLKDADKARETFAEFIHRYPRSQHAAEAKKAMAGVEQAAAKTKEEPAAKAKEKPADDSDDAADSATKNAEPTRVTGIRYWSAPDYTRIAIDLDQDVKFESQRIENPDRVYFDLIGAKLAPSLLNKNYDVNDGFLKQIRLGQFQSDRTRIVLDVDSISAYDTFLLSNPSRLVIDIHGKATPKLEVAKSEPAPVKASDSVASKTPKKVVVNADDDDDSVTTKVVTPSAVKPASARGSKPVRAKGKRRTTVAAAEPDAHEARPTANGDRSLIRALGLKIGKIVIDPGHGGHDTGTIGPNGLLEKDLVLEVGRRLGKLLETRMGADVVYTRSDDTFIPLETRTAIANQEQADLFVSIHANSSRDPDARGVETYYLNFTSSPEALEVAARENAVSEKSIHELQDLVKKIALKEKIEESKEFASDVQGALHSGLAVRNAGLRDRGVKKAPFIVLIGANMPSILAEISFVSNPADERRLKTSEYRQRIADSLYKGISRYVGGLSGVKVAARVDKGEPQ